MPSRTRTAVVAAAAIMLAGCLAQVAKQIEEDSAKADESLHKAIVAVAEAFVNDANNKCDYMEEQFKLKKLKGEEFEFDSQTLREQCLVIEGSSPKHRHMCAEFSNARIKSYKWDAKSRYYVRDAIKTANQTLIEAGLKPCL
ncbi:MAG: hypothetical protein OXN23_06315 [Gammaproteobacteria bacterium]|nr:hypothetical protein [Gammaproteobacteria bacterium]